MPGRTRRWVIGSGTDCDVVMPKSGVSARHCVLIQTPRGFVIEDQQSAEGTYVNGVRVQNRARITRADDVRLGDVPLRWPPEATLPGEVVFRVGRSPRNDLVLEHACVSPEHARVVLKQGRAFIQDLGSAHGTALDDPKHRIEQSLLHHHQTVYFGGLRYSAAALLAKCLAARKESVPRLAPKEPSLTLGRDPGADIVLNSPAIALWHARLNRSREGLKIEDLGSATGTYLNGKRLASRGRARIGDLIGVGPQTFVLADRVCHRFERQATLTARNVAVAVQGRQLISQVSFTALPGELVGIMGTSGAGKTTLMNALNGYARPTTGDVLINGRSLYDQAPKLTGLIGYVPQDDIIHRDLTVWQALRHAARLRLPRTSSEELDARIRDVMRLLGLAGTEHVIIGSPERRGISGGQRKRVNLALELLTDPLVLFLDEPTTGLSSEEALTVVRILRDLADGGTTVVLTIHQPSRDAFRLLDSLLVLAKDANSTSAGRLVYFGPAHPEAAQFFCPESEHPAELLPEDLLRGLARRPALEWVERFQSSPAYADHVKERSQRQPWVGTRLEPPRPPLYAGLLQWWTLSRRMIAIKTHQPIHVLVLLLQAPLIACLLVLVYGEDCREPLTQQSWPNVAGTLAVTLFLAGLAALWFGCSNAVREIVGEWAVIQRERKVGLRLLPYVASKLTVLGGLCVVQCAALGAVLSWGCGLEAPWWPLFGFLYLSAIIGVGFGLLLSAVSKNSEVAISLLPVVLLPMVILGGIMQPVHKMPRAIQFLSHAMASRWAFEGLLVLESDQRDTWTPPTPPRPPTSIAPNRPTPPVKTEAAPKARDMAERFFPADTDRLGVATSAVAMVAMLGLLIGATLLAIRWREG